MTPFSVYCDYVAIKRHFDSWSYDYHQYNGKVNLKPESFERRRDRRYFERLERHRDPRGVLVVAIANDPSAWIGDVLSAGVEAYDVHRGRMEALSRTIDQDLSRVRTSVRDVFVGGPGEHPPIVRMVMGGRLTLETATMLTKATLAGPWLRDGYGLDPIVGPTVRGIVRLDGFLTYDRDRVREKFLAHFVDKEEVPA